VTIKKRPLSADGTRLERRKSRRFNVAVPVEVSWRGPDGSAIKEEAVARRVNANGGYLKMELYPDSGVRVTLANFATAETAEARVLATPHAREGVANGIVVELIAPNEAFWGVDLQIEKASFELHNLEKALQFDDAADRLLKEYREAAECIRKIASDVQRLRDTQSRGQDDSELLSEMATGRIRRAIDLCAEVVADLDAGHAKIGSKDAEALYRTLEYLCGRVSRSAPPEPTSHVPQSPMSDSRPHKLIPAVPITRKAR
jgi:hypothetical protein